MKQKLSYLAILLSSMVILGGCNSGGTSGNNSPTNSDNSASNLTSSAVTAASNVKGGAQAQQTNCIKTQMINGGTAYAYYFDVINTCATSQSLTNNTIVLTSQDVTGKYAPLQSSNGVNVNNATYNLIFSSRTNNQVVGIVNSNESTNAINPNQTIRFKALVTGIQTQYESTTAISSLVTNGPTLTLTNPVSIDPNQYGEDTEMNTPVGNFGLKTLVLTNNNQNTIKNIKFPSPMPNGFAYAPVYAQYVTPTSPACKTDGTQQLSYSQSCLLIYKYQPTQNGQLGSYLVTESAINASTGLAESGLSVSIPYSSTGIAPVNKVDYLVVAGGGGGGTSIGDGSKNGIGGGGGGAGGLLSGTGFQITPGASYTITVGAAGTGGLNHTLPTNGGNSTFSSFTAIGGGASGLTNGASGGSGGGATSDGAGFQGGSGVAGQGYDGGDSDKNTKGDGSGGGGGSGSAGQNGNDSVAGSGGNGTQWYDPATGNLVFYAAGGGAGAVGSLTSNTNPGTGGSGIGGTGGDMGQIGQDAIGYGSGGGGGGATRVSNNQDAGGDGSAGIVIIRYKDTNGQIATGGLVTHIGGYYYHTFKTNGTFKAN